MASVEDSNLEGSQLAGKAKVHETTHIVAGEVRLPESGFERQRTHKVTNHDKPAKCSKGNCSLEASFRVQHHVKGPQNYCEYHFDKVGEHEYDPISKMVLRPEYGADVRGEDRVVRQQSRAEAAVELFKHTGEHVPVRGPGNPREVADRDADPVTPVINNAVVQGGRAQPVLSQVDHKALMHKIKVGGAPKGEDQVLAEINDDLSRNSRTEAPNSFDDISDLMTNDYAPSQREAGVRKGDRQDD
jgi:hypothetical protein